MREFKHVIFARHKLNYITHIRHLCVVTITSPMFNKELRNGHYIKSYIRTWRKELIEVKSCFRIVAPRSNVITEPATFQTQQKIHFGVYALREEMRGIGATCLQWTVPPRSTTNAPAEENASMTIRGSCTSVRVNKVCTREQNVKPLHQTYVLLYYTLCIPKMS